MGLPGILLGLALLIALALPRLEHLAAGAGRRIGRRRIRFQLVSNDSRARQNHSVGKSSRARVTAASGMA